MIILWLGVILLCTIILLFIMITIMRVMNRKKYKIETRNGIQESTYVDIGGIKQYIQIRGEDISKPFIIFIHGGPSGPMAYLSHYYQKELENEYNIVNYDQRACGRTYYANDKSINDVSPEQLLSDLDELADYIRNRFKKDKVIIMGHSWGAELGTLYIKEHPEKVSAYIGVSHVVKVHSGLVNIAEKALAKASEMKKAQDAQKLTQFIEKMSKKNNYENWDVKETFKVTAFASKYLSYEGAMSPLKLLWVTLTSPDIDFADIRWMLKRLKVEKLFNLQRNLFEYAFYRFDLNSISGEFQVPIYYIAGEMDHGIPQNELEAYYKTINAPDKKYIIMKNVGHNAFLDNPVEFCAILKEILAKYPS
jgi:pimeloyl-ACP methyl ester carboxylesterase